MNLKKAARKLTKKAKKEGTKLSVVADQSERYASSLPDFLAAGATGPLPFLYESTGIETYFRVVASSTTVLPLADFIAGAPSA